MDYKSVFYIQKYLSTTCVRYISTMYSADTTPPCFYCYDIQDSLYYIITHTTKTHIQERTSKLEVQSWISMCQLDNHFTFKSIQSQSLVAQHALRIIYPQYWFAWRPEVLHNVYILQINSTKTLHDLALLNTYLRSHTRYTASASRVIELSIRIPCRIISWAWPLFITYFVLFVVLIPSICLTVSTGNLSFRVLI